MGRKIICTKKSEPEWVKWAKYFESIKAHLIIDKLRIYKNANQNRRKMMISKKELLDEINWLNRYVNKHNLMIKKLQEDINKLQNSNQIIELKSENRQFQIQLQCAAKGHNFVFEKKEKLSLYGLVFGKGIYQFKCTNCDLIITKTADELTPKEKTALKTLGILEEKDENTKRN